MLPARAVTSNIAISGESLSANIITKDKQEIRETPLDKPV